MTDQAIVILRSGWRTAGTVAAATVGSALLLSLVLAFVGKQPDVSVHDTFTLMTALMTGAFGASFGGSAEDSGISVNASASAIPLTITLVALAATVIVFRRATAGYGRPLEALIDALRAALICGLVMMIFALVFTADSDGTKIHASAVGAFFLTLILVFGVLAVTVLLRRDWLHAHWAQLLHDWARAPILGLVAVFALLPVAGIIAALAVLLIGKGSSGYTGDFTGADWRLVVIGVIAYAGNLGLWAITLGTCGKVGVFGIDQILSMVSSLSESLGGDSQEFPTGGRLTWFTGTFHEPGLWVTVVLTPLLLAAAAYAVVRATGYAGKGHPAGPSALRGLLVWVVALLVAVPIFVRVANLHAHVEGPFGIDLSPAVGASGVGATFLLFAYALIIAAILAFALGLLDAATVRRAGAAVRTRLQEPSPTGYGQQGYGRPPAGPPGGPTQPPPAYRPPQAYPQSPPQSPPQAPPQGPAQG
ncbi:hypothetical protein [Nocardioides sp. KR10-350]|uniref:hypothetical protein n=1 Tax=Nocardioides cheoyonin TaxID=3156615 RepID=UPI0032B5C5FA